MHALAPWSPAVRGITFGVWGVLLWPVLMNALFGPAPFAVLLLVLVLPMAIGAFHGPTGLSVSELGLRVSRPAGDVEVAWDQVASAWRHHGDPLERRVGSGGFHGYFGTFVHHEHGPARAWVTDWSRVVLVRLHDGELWALSPADPESFLAAVHARVARDSNVV